MHRIDPEWATGTAWLTVSKIFSVGPPNYSSAVGCGWIDLSAIAIQTDIDKAELDKTWEPLVAAPR